MKVTVYIATSLDGFIARPDGGLDWLHESATAEKGEDYGYQAFFDTVDVLVMGRNTYEVVRTFGAWPYGDTPVVVLTNREIEIPSVIKGKVESMAGRPGEVVRRLDERGARHLYVDGGKTVQSFLAEGLIDRLILSRIPVLIGRGIPLFGPLPEDIKLRHVETRQYPSGLVQSEYEIH